MQAAPQADVVERVGSYIRYNAAKDPPALRALVEQGQTQIDGLLAGLTEDQARFKPSADDWSVMELMNHVVTAKGGVARICARLGRGETIEGAGREGDEQNGITGTDFASLAEARVAARAAHEELIVFVDGISPATNVETRFNHFVFGDLNCREWAAFQRVHDGDHSGQIEQIKAASGYPA